MEITNLDEMLADPSEARWESHPKVKGFKVLIRLPDAPEAFALGARAWENKTFQAVKLFAGQADYCLLDWKGLTVAGLKQLLPSGAVKAQKGVTATTAIKCTPETKAALLRHSLEFFDWLMGRIFARKQVVEEAEKNS